MAAKKRTGKKKKRRQAKAQRRQRELKRTREAAKKAPPPAIPPEPRPVVPTKPPFNPQQATPEESPDEASAFLDFGGTDIFDDPEVAIAAFQEGLEAGTLDAEDAFEYLISIRDALGGEDPEARARFAALVDQLRRQAPELYRQNIGYFTDALIGDAIAEGRWDAIPDLLTPFVEEPDRHPESFASVIDQLLYHGQTRTLRDAMCQAWPAVQTSGELLPWAIGEFGAHLMLLELFEYLETAEAHRADDPTLLEATAPYGEWQAGSLEQIIPRLTAPAPSPWQRADFGEAVDADQWNENLDALLTEFVADRRRAGVPLSRAYMARVQLREFLSWQFSNPTLSGAPEVWPQTKRKGKRRKREEQVGQPNGSPLVPRHALLDRFLVKLFSFLGAQPHKAAALLELLPGYLHFLARLNLIHPTEMDQALEELCPLGQQALPILRSYGADPVAVNAVAVAWAEETLAALRDDPALAAARAAPPPEPSAPPPAPAPRPDARETYTFKVTYLRKPGVWRSIEIAGDQSLDDLHHAIQGAVHFDADHLYSFYMSNRAWDETTEYASPHADGPSAANVRIRDLGLRLKQRFLYLFDYGDQHEFEVQLVSVNPDAPKGKYPRVVERHGRNPQQYRS